jgi:hypothetical protein
VAARHYHLSKLACGSNSVLVAIPALGFFPYGFAVGKTIFMHCPPCPTPIEELCCSSFMQATQYSPDWFVGSQGYPTTRLRLSFLLLLFLQPSTVQHTAVDSHTNRGLGRE